MFKQLIVSIAQKFAEHKIPYIIMGGQAVLLYGEPRLTKDIDITLGLNIDAVDKIIEILKEISLEVIPQDIHQFVSRTMVLPLIHPGSGIRVDIIFSFSTYEQEAIQRANLIKIENTEVNYVSVEDLIVFKIFSGRPRDIEDARLIFVKQKNIDTDYIRMKLKNLSFEDRDLLKEFDEFYGNFCQ